MGSTHSIKKAGLVYLSLVNAAGRRRMLEEQNMLRPSLGLGYLAAALKVKGIQAQVYDQVLSGFSAPELAGFLKRDQIDLVGFYVVSRNLEAVTDYISVVKEQSGLPVIAGGPGYKHLRELFIAGCDIVCRGEGDQTIGEIAEYYQGRRSLDAIKGISYYDPRSKSICDNPERPLIEDLDSLPFPLAEPMLLKKQGHYLAYPLRQPYVSVLASRGCPYRCAFCTSCSFWKGKFRRRSVKNVIAEIEGALGERKARSVQFVDDIFALDFGWLAEFCQEVKKRRLRFGWMCNLHPLTFRRDREAAFSMMKEAGCAMISFGAQSADPQVLQKVNRSKEEPEELRRSIRAAKSSGITTVVTYIFGLPGETRETMRKSLEFCLETRPHLADFHPLELIPFSELNERCGDGRICGFSNGEIAAYCGKSMIRYHTAPAVAFQLLLDMLRKNPSRISVAGKIGLSLFRESFRRG